MSCKGVWLTTPRDFVVATTRICSSLVGNDDHDLNGDPNDDNMPAMYWFVVDVLQIMLHYIPELMVML